MTLTTNGSGKFTVKLKPSEVRELISLAVREKYPFVMWEEMQCTAIYNLFEEVEAIFE